MKLLEQIISTIDSEKLSKFEKSLIQKGKNFQGKDVEIFKKICLNQRIDIVNKNAFHSTRKRLVSKLIDFININEITDSESIHTKVHSYLTVAEYLFNHNAEKSAWILLGKAEKIALENESYHIINDVYLKQIELANSIYADSIDSINLKFTQNKKALELDEKMTISSKMIEIELQKIILTGENKQFDNVINYISEQLNLSDGVLNNPKFAYQFLNISRNITKAQKAYYQFEPFINQTYKTLKENGSFTPKFKFYEVSILYMLCHAQYRTRNFDDLKSSLNLFESAIKELPLSKQKQFQSKFITLKASNLSYTNQLSNAIQTLENYNDSRSDLEQIALDLNLGLYYFMNKEYSKALSTNRKFKHSEKWMEKHLGLEWVMKKLLMEIIIHYDMQNLDLVENLIRSFEKRFKPLLILPKYQNLKPFINFIKSGMKSKNIYFNKMEAALTQTPAEKEDFQAMIFYVWLKAKVLKQDFYKCLLVTI